MNHIDSRDAVRIGQKPQRLTRGQIREVEGIVHAPLEKPEREWLDHELRSMPDLKEERDSWTIVFKHPRADVELWIRLLSVSGYVDHDDRPLRLEYVVDIFKRP